jgi:hypothetical protein
MTDAHCPCLFLPDRLSGAEKNPTQTTGPGEIKYGHHLKIGILVTQKFERE